MHHNNLLEKAQVQFTWIDPTHLCYSFMNQRMNFLLECAEKEFQNFLDLLIPSLRVLKVKYEHVKMKCEFNMIRIQVKYESNPISTKVK